MCTLYSVMKKQNDWYIENFAKLKKRVFLKTVKISLISILIFGFLGYSLDTIFNTKPIFLVVSICLSFPITQIFVVKFNKVQKDAIN